MSAHFNVNVTFSEPCDPVCQDAGPLPVAALPRVARPGPGPHLLALAAGDAPAQDLPPAPPHLRPGVLLHGAGQAVQEVVRAHKERQVRLNKELLKMDLT